MKTTCHMFALQAVGLLLPWWVQYAVPAMLRFIAAGRDTKHDAHIS